MSAGDQTGLTVERVTAALQNAAGIKSAAAHMLGVHRVTLYRFISENPELERVAQECDEQTLDLAESKMITAIKNDDFQMIRFYLERKGRHRGYGHKQEISGPNGGPIPVDMPTIDVSKLSLDERKALLALHAKAKLGDANQS